MRVSSVTPHTLSLLLNRFFGDDIPKHVSFSASVYGHREKGGLVIYGLHPFYLVWCAYLMKPFLNSVLRLILLIVRRLDHGASPPGLWARDLDGIYREY